MNKTVYPNYTILRSVTIIYVDIMKKIYIGVYIIILIDLLTILNFIYE